MPISDIPIFSMLRTRMHWQQERQRLLAENVANADTPGFQPRDLAPLRLDRPQASSALPLLTTSPLHLAMAGDAPQFEADRKDEFETRPAGNGVSLEDEMMKVAGNQMDFQAATSLYSRSLGLIKTAIGKK